MKISQNLIYKVWLWILGPASEFEKVKTPLEGFRYPYDLESQLKEISNDKAKLAALSSLEAQDSVMPKSNVEIEMKIESTEAATDSWGAVALEPEGINKGSLDEKSLEVSSYDGGFLSVQRPAPKIGELWESWHPQALESLTQELDRQQLELAKPLPWARRWWGVKSKFKALICLPFIWGIWLLVCLSEVVSQIGIALYKCVPSALKLKVSGQTLRWLSYFKKEKKASTLKEKKLPKIDAEEDEVFSPIYYICQWGWGISVWESLQTFSKVWGVPSLLKQRASAISDQELKAWAKENRWPVLSFFKWFFGFSKRQKNRVWLKRLNTWSLSAWFCAPLAIPLIIFAPLIVWIMFSMEGVFRKEALKRQLKMLNLLKQRLESSNEKAWKTPLEAWHYQLHLWHQLHAVLSMSQHKQFLSVFKILSCYHWSIQQALKTNPALSAPQEVYWHPSTHKGALVDLWFVGRNNYGNSDSWDQALMALALSKEFITRTPESSPHHLEVRASHAEQTLVFMDQLTQSRPELLLWWEGLWTESLEFAGYDVNATMTFFMRNLWANQPQAHHVMQFAYDNGNYPYRKKVGWGREEMESELAKKIGAPFNLQEALKQIQDRLGELAEQGASKATLSLLWKHALMAYLYHMTVCFDFDKNSGHSEDYLEKVNHYLDQWIEQVGSLMRPLFESLIEQGFNFKGFEEGLLECTTFSTYLGTKMHSDPQGLKMQERILNHLSGLWMISERNILDQITEKALKNTINHQPQVSKARRL